MPITPFHFGPGILLKACAPRSVSFTAFAAVQIVIDLESGYHLLRGDWPIHREGHSLLVSGLLGVVTAFLIWLTAQRFPQPPDATGRAELELSSALLGGLVGGLSHPLLDAIMHSDLRPFWPLSAANPFLDAVGLGALHLACAAAGLVGLAILSIRSHTHPSSG